jgi:hypothetical protein
MSRHLLKSQKSRRNPIKAEKASNHGDEQTNQTVISRKSSLNAAADS